MDELKEVAQLRRMLNDAMALLGDVNHKFGLFENQRYGKLKTKLSDHDRLNNKLISVLANIETADN